MSRGPKMSLALETDVVQDNIPCEVIPNIYIGSIHAAFNQEALINLGITHILNASRLPSTFPKNFTYLSIDIRDREDANILSSIPASNIFIEAGVDSGGVLVHCYGGRSRSAAFVCAFLMSSYGWPYEQAVESIYRARPVACINQGFESQLRAYLYSHYDVYVAQQMLLLGRVQALQRYRAIRGTSQNELEFKASQRKKFGINNVLSGGGGTRGDDRKKNSNSHQGESHSGMKRSWRSSKNVEDKSADDNHCMDEDNYEDECAEHNFDANCEEDSEEQLSRAAAAMRKDRSNSISSDVVVGGQPSPKDGSTTSNLRKHIPLLDPRSPRCRLSRPGSTAVRIIPPLRGLERVFCCSWCQFNLFNLASVIRTDLDLRPLREMLPPGQDQPRDQFVADEKSSSRGGYFTSGSKGIDIKDDDAGKTSMPAPSTTMSRNGNSNYSSREDKWGISTSSATTTSSLAPPKQLYREPPKTMRNRDAKSFDFAGFGSSPKSKSNPNLMSQQEDDDKMDVVGNEMEENNHGSASVPKLSIDNRNRVDCGSYSARGLSGTMSPTASGSVPPRHSGSNSGRGLQIHSHLGSNCTSPLESPRIPFPPHRKERSSFTYPSPRDRPQSAEKTRWLARVNLLGQGDPHVHGQTNQGHKGELIDKMSQDDDEAVKLGFGRDKYIHVEYLEWMGEDLLSSDINEGELKCGQCQRVIGTWTWDPHPKHTFFGQLEPPLIRVHKNVVQEVDLPLDATPANTPRLDELTRSPTSRESQS